MTLLEEEHVGLVYLATDGAGFCGLPCGGRVTLGIARPPCRESLRALASKGRPGGASLP